MDSKEFKIQEYKGILTIENLDKMIKEELDEDQY